MTVGPPRDCGTLDVAPAPTHGSPIRAVPSGFSVRASRLAVAAVVVGSLAWHGCALLPLAALSGAALEAGGGAIVKTGTEYTASGKVIRTFSNSVDEVHAAVHEAFRRTQVAVVKDQLTKTGYWMEGAAEHRKMKVSLTRLTPVLTTLQLNVKRNFFASDKATVSELLAQIEHILDEARKARHVETGIEREPSPEPTRAPTPARMRHHRRHCPAPTTAH